jgi:hypothetical protein
MASSIRDQPEPIGVSYLTGTTTGACCYRLIFTHPPPGRQPLRHGRRVQARVTSRIRGLGLNPALMTRPTERRGGQLLAPEKTGPCRVLAAPGLPGQ